MRKIMKIIIICLVIAIPAGIYAVQGCYSSNSASLKTGGSLILACEIPEHTKSVPIVTLKTPSPITEEAAMNIASKFVKNPRKPEIWSDGAYWVKGDDGVVQIFPSGAVIYTTDMLDKRKGYGYEITKDEAERIAVEFIKNHGGMPEDAYLGGTDIIVGLNRETGDKKIKAYIFEFYHDFNGIPIRGNGGDSIKVIVNSYGEVIYYFRLWREPKSIVERSELKISAEKALEALQQNRHIMKYAGDVYVTNVNLVYYSMPFDKGIQEKLTPAWRFQVTGKGPEGEFNEAKGLFIYVDALTGKPLLPKSTAKPTTIVDNDIK